MHTKDKFNIYLGNPVEILEVRRHTPVESSFILKGGLKGVPGQFVMVSVPYGGEVPISISSFGEDFIEVTIRKTGAVTSSIFNYKEGRSLYIRGPYGNGFSLEEFRDRYLVIIAGGSAIAPAKGVVESYLCGSLNLKRLDVLVGFKSPRHILFHKELESWKKRCHVLVTVDNDEDYAWLGSIGFVVQFIKEVPDIGEETRAIVIGPPLMMRNAVMELSRHNVKEENIWVSFERHMKCGVGKCGHCRIGEKYVCTDGPVFNYVEAKELID